MTDIDTRRGVRYAVQLTCKVSSPLQFFNELSGVTMNMSRCGLLALFGEAAIRQPQPLVGTPVRITLKLPCAHGKSARRLECLGRVVRVNEEHAPLQVAFALQRYQFQAASPDDVGAFDPISFSGNDVQ
jgi:hypothetical protein